MANHGLHLTVFYGPPSELHVLPPFMVVWGENADLYFPDTETMVGWVEPPRLVPFPVCVPESRKSDIREYAAG